MDVWTAGIIGAILVLVAQRFMYYRRVYCAMQEVAANESYEGAMKALLNAEEHSLLNKYQRFPEILHAMYARMHYSWEGALATSPTLRAKYAIDKTKFKIWTKKQRSKK